MVAISILEALGHDIVHGITYVTTITTQTQKNSTVLIKVHIRVESSGLSFNTTGMATGSVFVFNEAARLESEGQILPRGLIGMGGRRAMVSVVELTGNSCYLRG